MLTATLPAEDMAAWGWRIPFLAAAPLGLAGLFLLGLCLVCFLATIPSTLPSLFPTPVRYGAFAISYNVGVSLFGGTAPLLIEFLTTRSDNAYVPAFYIMGAMLIAVVPILMSPETARRPLPATYQEATERLRAPWRARH